MADRFYGVNRGQDAKDVTVGAASPSANVELVVDDAVGLSKLDVINAIDLFKKAILEDAGFTAGG